MGCLGMMPTNRRFIVAPRFSVSEMNLNKGEGMHINPLSHPFHSSKRLRLGGTKVIRLQIIPRNTAKSSTNSQAVPQPFCRLKRIYKICSWTSCLLPNKLPETFAAAPPSWRWGNRVFIFGCSVEGGCLPWWGSLHTWCTFCHPSLFSYTSRRNISRQRFTTKPSNTLSLLISSSQMQMCCTLLCASRLPHFEKRVSERMGNPRKVSEKVWFSRNLLMLRWVILAF